MSTLSRSIVCGSMLLSAFATNVVQAIPQDKSLDDFSGLHGKKSQKQEPGIEKPKNKTLFGYIGSKTKDLKEAVCKYLAVIAGAICLGEVAHAAYKINSVKDSKGKVVFIMGKACSGKGANDRIITDMYNLEPYGPGNDCREEIKKTAGESLLTDDDRALLQKGLMISDNTVCKITKRAVSKTKKGLLMDGFPRNIAQCQWLEENDFSPDVVVYLDAPDSYTLYKVNSRLTCTNHECGQEYDGVFNKPKKPGICSRCGHALIHREQDTEKVIHDRLKEFYKDTIPVIDHYKKQGKVVTIKSDRSPEEVKKDLVKALRERKELEGYEDNFYAKLWRKVKSLF